MFLLPLFVRRLQGQGPRGEEKIINRLANMPNGIGTVIAEISSIRGVPDADRIENDEQGLFHFSGRVKRRWDARLSWSRWCRECDRDLAPLLRTRPRLRARSDREPA